LIFILEAIKVYISLWWRVLGNSDDISYNSELPVTFMWSKFIAQEFQTQRWRQHLRLCFQRFRKWKSTCRDGICCLDYHKFNAADLKVETFILSERAGEGFEVFQERLVPFSGPLFKYDP
jgi:hypothetical protein